MILSPVERAMFASMMKSLQIPHFLFTHSIEFTEANRQRKLLNQGNELKAAITSTAIVVKAISEALNKSQN